MEKIHKKIIVYDRGYFLSLAVKLSEQFDEVLYCCPWERDFASTNDYIIGRNVKGIKKIDNIWNYIDDVDGIFFTFLHDGDQQEYWRKHGKIVWGMGKAEWLELKRWDSKLKMKELGLPVNATKVFYGLDNLRAHLKTVENKHVKFSTFRGDIQTFHHREYWNTEPYLNRISTQLGLLQKMSEFIVEDDLPAQEIGSDPWCIDGKYPNSFTWGFEVKDKLNLAVIAKREDMPWQIRECQDRTAVLLKKSRGFCPTELRIDEDSVPFLEDWTTRCFSDDTEILTDKGWKCFKELDGSEKVCTLNPTTEEIEYHKPDNYQKYQYKGDLINLTNQDKTVDFLVTPEHEFYVHNREKVNPLKVKAAELKGKRFIKRDGIWKGKETEYFILPEYHNEWVSGNGMSVNRVKHCPEISIKTEAWLSFMAIYLSDGCTSKGSLIHMAQFDKIEEYEKILKALPFKYARTKHGFQIPSVQLVSYLKQFGVCSEKYIPEFIKNLSPRLINIFLDTYLMADGSLKNGRQRVFYTTSRKLADDLQELIFKSGGVGCIYEKEVKGTIASFQNGKSYVRNFNGFVISERKDFNWFYFEASGVRKDRYIKKQEYEGMVYDVTVKNHIIYVRRNGKPMWSGNCPSPPMESIMEAYENIGEIMWEGAQGHVVEPKFKHKFVGQVLIHLDCIFTDPHPIEIDKGWEHAIKLNYYTVDDDGHTFIVPTDTSPDKMGMQDIGSIVASGDTIEEVFEKIKEASKHITADDLLIRTGSMEDVYETIKKAREIGIDFPIK